MLFYGNYERQDEINDRIVATQFPASPAEPAFDPRPTPTKYMLFPIQNIRAQPEVAIEHQPNFSVARDFMPTGGSRAPFAGFSIDNESRLHNQFFALSRGGIQNVYIPSSQSDLYRVPVPYLPSVQPYPGLFKQEVFDGGAGSAAPYLERVGHGTFHNHTRTQLRGDGSAVDGAP